MNRLRLEALLALVGFAALTVAMSWPLVRHFREFIPLSHPAFDPISLLYAVTWGARALLHDPLHYFQAAPFHPHPASLTFYDVMVGLSAMAAPVDRATGNMCVAYNAVWFSTFALAAWGVYLLVRVLTRSAAAGILAGAIFAFHPFRYHNAGQINVLAVMWVPVALLALHLWVRTGRRRWLVASAAFALIQVLSSGYTAVFLFLAVVLYLTLLLVRERARTTELLRRDRWWMLGAALAAVLLALPFVSPFLGMVREQDTFRRSLGQCALFSALPADFVTAAPGSLLNGIVQWAGSARHALFPGVMATVLALAWVSRRGWRGHPWRTELLFYAWLIPLGAVLALGPALPVAGRWVPMPFALLWYVVPGVSFIRAPVRFVTLAALGVAVVAGAGLAQEGDGGKGGGRRRWASWVAAALAVGELAAAPIPLIRPLPERIPSAYAWVAAQPDSVVIAELPMQPDEPSENATWARYQLHSLQHGKRLVNGVAAFTPLLTRALGAAMRGFPDGEAVARLREVGVSVVLLHRDQYTAPAWDGLVRAVGSHPELRIISSEDPVWVVGIRPPGPGL